jgi:lipopolysaccharide transport system permease protein
MIITPIIYVPSLNFPDSLLNWVNPAAPLLIVSRDLLLYGGTEFGLLAIVFGLAAIVLMLVSLVVYRVSLPVLIERMMA